MSDVYFNCELLRRHPENPIIMPAHFPGAYSIFNPGQVMFEGKTLLLLPIAHNANSKSRFGQGITAHVALSDDGIHFDINPEPLFLRSTEPPFSTVREQCIDFRVTPLEGYYYIIHPGCGIWGTMGILARTKDWKSFENIEIVSLPDNRVPCLFPEKINGKYYRLDRPYRMAPNDHHFSGHLWLSSSPDLVHWGCHRPLLRPGFSHWNQTKVGATPPVKTPHGWFCLLHGVVGSCAGYRYGVGGMLLDLDNPEKIVGLSKSAFLLPTQPSDFQGQVPNVVFPAGFIGDWERDDLRLYYGSADTYVGLASGSLREAVQLCIDEYDA
jgi:beta-1,4-mannooligosaccharide/beta-1,4-mannosyl-N-acetylglucosamine phosphorylase